MSGKHVCRQCGKPAALDPSNPWRPFCSERCKTLDLGDWFSGRYAIPAETADEFSEDSTDSPPGSQRHQ